MNESAKQYYEAIATLTGCIIGAGILGIPYVFVKAGFWTGMVVLVVIGIAMLVVHLLIGEVALRTKKCHQLVGYAQKYLGNWGKRLMLFSMCVGIYGALLAYTIGVGQSLTAVFGGTLLFWSSVFYILMAFLLFGGIKVLAESELWMEALKLFIFAIVVIMLFASSNFSADNLAGFSLENLFVPYGVVLFAFIGTAAIPEVREETKKCLFIAKKAIIIGSLIPLIIYTLFALAVVGVSGAGTTEVATIGTASVGNAGFVLMQLFAILAMTTSFAALGYALKESYNEDFGITKFNAWLLTMVIPPILAFLLNTSFVKILDITGTITGGIVGILAVLMHARARKMSERKPEYEIRINIIGYTLLIVLFAAGIISVIIQMF
ncbi:MAG: amino acid permease [Candidatus Aenigmarchaeota archaeon]|nr:amino acid permease [Candidatus Aenigmarchaeota archaeon]